MIKKLPALAVVLSSVPGLGLWYVGKKKKAAAILLIACGLVVSLYYMHSKLALAVVGVAYLLTTVPAGIESYLIAKTGHTSPMLDSKLYILLMLWTQGINALPLLWQSELFSKRAK